MCAFLRGTTCTTGCLQNQLQPVQISPVALFETAGPVQFSVFFWLHGLDLQTLPELHPELRTPGEPIYMADSTLPCPDCGEEIHVGTGGSKNLETHCASSKVCKAQHEQKAVTTQTNIRKKMFALRDNKDCKDTKTPR